MWCSSCQQDVLPVASMRGELARDCVQCGKVLAIHDSAPTVSPPLSPASLWGPPVHQRGLLSGATLRFNEAPASLRFDGAHHGAHRPMQPESPPQSQRTPIFVWPALMIGLAAMTCGIVLTGWSVAAGRDDFFRVGLPVAAGGLSLFLVGIALQLDGIGTQSRRIIRLFEHRLYDRAAQSKPAGRKRSLTHSQANDPTRVMHDLTHRLQEFASEIPREF